MAGERQAGRASKRPNYTIIRPRDGPRTAYYKLQPPGKKETEDSAPLAEGGTNGDQTL